VRHSKRAASFAAKSQCLYRQLATQPATILSSYSEHDWSELKLNELHR
jgi:hypothetical protein